MIHNRSCSACGVELTVDACSELCLACLLKAGLGMQQSANAVPIPAPPSEPFGDRISNFKLLQQIGEGGCGIVYMADQLKPVRRRVALKVIKLGMDTRRVIARFEAERQALALMDHPNIAKVLGAGTTESGLPFFVMELVKGISITRYCDENKLDARRRLELFIKVCQAVQHAHQKGIIHRDIKPSNILVADHDGVMVPKVIDFGIAKATTDQPLTDKTLYTAIEQFIGTPAYMSPEQAKLSGLDVDTRSDIYSLGVLLYELLTGRTPFDNKLLISAGLDEIRRIIREQEPPRPSAKLSTLDAAERTAVAARRHSHPPKLVGLIRGDLDWIVMKCLEKDRTRRYETATSLAADIERHLIHEPVFARPPTIRYRVQKFFGKHWVFVTTAAAFLLLLTAASTFSFRLAIIANREREKAANAEKLAQKRAELAQNAASTERLARNLAEEQSYLASINGAAAAIKSGQSAVARAQLIKAPIGHRMWEWNALMNKVSDARQLLACEARCFGSDPLANYVAIADSLDLVLVPRAEGQLRIRLNGQPGGVVYKVAFSEDSSMLAKVGCALGQRVQAWRLRDGALISDFDGCDVGQGNPLALDQHGGLLAIGCSDNTVAIYNTSNKQLVSTVPKQAWNIWTLLFQPRTALLFVGEETSSPLVWNSQNGTIQATFDEIRGVSAAAFSSDGERLGIVDNGGRLRVIDTSSWHVVGGVPLGLPGKVCSLAIDTETQIAIAGSFDGSIQFVSLKTMKAMAPRVGHDTRVASIRVVGEHAYTTGADGSMLEWGTAHASTENWQMNPEGAIEAVSACERYGLLASVSWNGTIRVWSLVTKKQYLLQPGSGNWNNAVAFADSGQVLASITEGVLRLWDPLTGTLLAESPRRPLSHLCLGASLDGPEVLSADRDGIFSYDRTGLTKAVPLALPEMKYVRLLYKPPESPLLAVGVNDKLLVIDQNTSTIRTTLTGFTNAIVKIASGRAGGIWATFEVGGRLRIWQDLMAAPIEKHMPIWDRNPHLRGLSFAKDGSRLFAGGRVLNVIDPLSGNVLMFFDFCSDIILWLQDQKTIITDDGSGILTSIAGLAAEESGVLADRNRRIAAACLGVAAKALETSQFDRTAAARIVARDQNIENLVRGAAVVEVLSNSMKSQ